MQGGEHDHLGDAGSLRRVGSMPALRVVGFQPSVLRVSTMMEKSTMGGSVEYSRLSSPLSQMLVAERNSSDAFHRGGSFGESSTTSGGEVAGMLSNTDTSGSDDGIMSTLDSTASEMQHGEKNLEGFEHVVVAATPIDIPYNVHGVRHWRR